MSTVADYNPLSSIELLGATLDNPRGELIIVIGPNSSGKTLFLRDIQQYLLTGQPRFVVCKSIKANKPESLRDYLDDLLANNLLRRTGNQNEQYIPYVPTFIDVPGKKASEVKQFNDKQIENGWNSFGLEHKANNEGFFGFLGSVLVAPLTLEMRLNVCDQSPAFDWRKTRPVYPLQALFINTNAKDRLESETGSVFGNAAWLDTVSDQSKYHLRVSWGPNAPSKGEITNPMAASKYWSVQREGDGYKSYVGICLSLLVGMPPVTLIDEPELCLHPPQAHQIGRFVGEHSNRPNRVTFVATHSSHCLRGMLETGKRMRVLRLTRTGREFRAHSVQEDDLREAMRNARTRVESILDGLFAQAVIIVESEGDREVYQAASETRVGYASRELHFVYCGGSGGIPDVARFYRKLQIPVAIITDLDTITDVEKVSTIVKILSSDGKGDEEFVKRLRKTVDAIGALPPSITPEEVKSGLDEIGKMPMNWSGGDDNVVKRKLGELVNRIKRMRRLKDGGVASYADHANIQLDLQSAVDRAKTFGLYFVPCGEVDDWVPQLMNDLPKTSELSKLERAIIMAERIRQAEEKSGDVWDFVDSVMEFLSGALEDTSDKG